MRSLRIICVGAVLGVTLAQGLPSALATTNVIVQGGTTIKDSGLLANVVVPGFEAAYPQYTLQFVAVGTTQALINAENGLGDAVWTHAPSAETDFVNAGYSYEPTGRYTMASDFVTVGATSDPAGVLTNDPNDQVAAFEAIAAAGEAGHADFVSRGDGSGTNVKEKQIWALTDVPLNTLGEPGTPSTTTDAPWYHKSGAGQATTMNVVDQCNFTSGKCYGIVDRGTFLYLRSQGLLAQLSILAQYNNAPTAVGGTNLTLNPYHAYAVNPAKVPTVNIPGAMAFLHYVTSPAFQTAVGEYPTDSAPAFTPEAFPTIHVTTSAIGQAQGGTMVKVAGTVAPNFQFDSNLAGWTAEVVRTARPGKVLAATTLSGSTFKLPFHLSFPAKRSGSYEVMVPQHLDRRRSSEYAGTLDVIGAPTLSIKKLAAPRTVKASGEAQPVGDRINAEIVIQGLRQHGTGWKPLTSIFLGNNQAKYALNVTLPLRGAWDLRAKYEDPGAVSTGYSAVRTVAFR